MQIRFLGTGTSQGIPVIGCDHPVCLSSDTRDVRMRSSIMVETEKIRIVIDCGQEFRIQMLQANVSHLDALLITHEHADHTAGLDDIRQFSLRNGPLPLYAHPRVMNNLRERFRYIFDDTVIYEGKPKVIPNELDGKPFYINGEMITPIDAIHGQMQVYGYRIRNMAYLTDVSEVPVSQWDKLKDLDVLVVDALRIKSHPTHFNLKKALEFIEEIRPHKSFLTHISYLLGFHSEVQSSLPENVFLSYDGLEVSCGE